MPKQTDSIELTNSLQGTVEYTASQEIIPEEKILEQGSFTYTSNGERTENPSEGYDGFSNVAVNVNVQPNLQSKSVSYTENNDYTVEPDDGYQGLSSVAVNVNVPQGGGTEAPENDVEFIDYDGTIVYSYTAQEFLALDAMPANPTHEGLTAQGWNWTLADAKEYVSIYGWFQIAQLYITNDGKTRLYITIPDDAPENRRKPVFRFYNYSGASETKGFTIDYGDGTTTEHITGTGARSIQNHTYASGGSYVVTIMPDEGVEVWLGSGGSGTSSSSEPVIGHYTSGTNRYYNCMLYKIELGERAGISNYGCQRCEHLKIVSIPNASIYIGDNAFAYNYMLNSISLPSTMTSIGRQVFSNAHGLSTAVLPKSLTSVDGLFNGCEGLSSIILPKTLTSLVNTPFHSCYSLLSITFPSTTNSIAASSFQNCGLGSIKFLGTTPPTVANSSAWTNLPTDCTIYVPYSEDHSVLNAYKTATNYPNPSTYTYVEY